MSSTLGASLLRTVLSDGTLKILGSGLDKGPIIVFQAFRLVNVLQVTESIPKGLYNKDKKSHMICSASGITIDDWLDVDNRLFIRENRLRAKG